MLKLHIVERYLLCLEGDGEEATVVGKLFVNLAHGEADSILEVQFLDQRISIGHHRLLEDDAPGAHVHRGVPVVEQQVGLVGSRYGEGDALATSRRSGLVMAEFSREMAVDVCHKVLLVVVVVVAKLKCCSQCHKKNKRVNG